MKRGERSATRRMRTRWAFTLIELLLAFMILAIVLAVAWPSLRPSSHEQLRAAAQIVAAELWQARDYAITFNSKYRVVFDVPGNRLYWKHAGNNPALDVLPADVVVESGGDPKMRVLDLGERSALIGRVHLLGAATFDASAKPVEFVEFGPTGSLETARTAMIWLTDGESPSPRYVTIIIDGVTGSVQVGPIDAMGPPGWLFP
ncbi:hypothetical protein JCM17478_17190 [Thermopirellula anaerolimosa]